MVETFLLYDGQYWNGSLVMLAGTMSVIGAIVVVIFIHSVNEFFSSLFKQGDDGTEIVMKKLRLIHIEKSEHVFATLEIFSANFRTVTLSFFRPSGLQAFSPEKEQSNCPKIRTIARSAF